MKLNQMRFSIRIGLVAAIVFVLVRLSVWPAIADSDTALKNCVYVEG